MRFGDVLVPGKQQNKMEEDTEGVNKKVHWEVPYKPQRLVDITAGEVASNFHSHPHVFSHEHIERVPVECREIILKYLLKRKGGLSHWLKRIPSLLREVSSIAWFVDDWALSPGEWELFIKALIQQAKYS